MEFFKNTTQIDFMAQRPFAAGLSMTLFMLAILSLAIKGLYWGLDFTGGTQVQLTFTHPAPLGALQNAFQQAGFQDVSAISYGTAEAVLLSLSAPGTGGSTHATASWSNTMIKKNEIDQVLAAFHPAPQVEQVNYIGPQVGQEMMQKGILAIVVALLGTMVYIALRFDWRFALGALLALVHDPIIILGLFSSLHLEFNLIALAAVLTVIGYSLNDTIVIFDRVRENFHKFPQMAPSTVMNQAINQTLSRTMITSALTFTVVLTLFLLGGQLLHGFAIAMMVGIIVGTYSSIYVAGSLALALGVNQQLSPTTSRGNKAG